MKFKLVTTQPVKEDIVSFIFEPEQPVSWQPGQYFHYVLPHPNADDRGTERWFTCSAAPTEGHVMISTRLAADHGSSFKQALRQMQPGDTIEADGPEGDFTISDFDRNYIFVAGGIGITPFRSVLVEASRRSEAVKATLLYANRSTDIPFSEELEQIAAGMPSLHIEYILQPNRINLDLLKQHIEAVDNPLVYLSGPEPMVKGFAAELTEAGYSKDIVKLDDFPGYEAD
jgi:ferredoxin-NADP reductase